MVLRWISLSTDLRNANIHTMRPTVQVILVPAAFAVTSISCVATPPPAPKGTDVVLVLSNALLEQESLFVYMHIEDRMARKAFSLAPDFNPMPHETLCDALMVAPDRIVGPILVKWTPDAWVPTTNDTDSIEYMLDLKPDGNCTTGRYECIRQHKYKHKGTLEGSTIKARSLLSATRLSLHMENAFPVQDAVLTDTNAWRRRGLMEVRLDRGCQKGAAPLVNSHHKHGWTALAKSLRFRSTPPAFTATMKARFDSGWYRYEFSGLHIADRIAGTFKVKRGDHTICDGVFKGTLDAGKPPAPASQLGYRVNEDGMPVDERGAPLPHLLHVHEHPPPDRPPVRRPSPRPSPRGRGSR